MINDSALYAPCMAKLIYSALTSLDGYVSDEEGNFDWATPREEVHGFANDLERSIWTHFTGDFSFICGLVRKDAAQPGRIHSHLRPCAERRSPTPAESPPICGLVREDVARPGRECRPRLRPGDAGSAMLPPPASGAEYHRDDSDV